MKTTTTLLAIFCLSITSLACCLLSCEATESKKSTVSAYPAAIDELIDEYYQLLSGKGEKDWDRFRSLCLPDAQFNVMGVNEEGLNQFYPSDLETYLGHIAPYVRDRGYFLTETFRDVDHYNQIAQVWTAFSATNEPGGKIIDRALMSLHLIELEGEWKIANQLMNSEVKNQPVPDRYLIK